MEEFILKTSFSELYRYFLLIFLTFFFLSMGAGFILNYKLSHEYPTGYFAQDSYFHELHSEEVYNRGYLTHSPKYAAFGREDIVLKQPPGAYYIVAYFAHAAGLKVYDAQQALMGLFLFLIALSFVVFLLKINLRLALVASPIIILQFVFPFYAIYSWGLVLFLTASVAMFAFIYLTPHINQKYEYFLITILLTSIVISHFIEFFYLIGALVFYILISQLFLKERSNVRLILIALALAFILSFPRIWITLKTINVFEKSSLLSGFNYGSATVYANHFGILWYVVLFGVLVSVALIWFKKQMSKQIIVPLILFLISMAPVVGILSRAYQLRFVWPVLLSLFFGLAIFIILENIKVGVKVKNGLAFLLFLLLFGVLFLVKYSPTPPQSVISKGYWKSLELLEAQPEGFVLFVDPAMYQVNHVWKTKKVSFMIPLDELQEKVNEQKVTQFFMTKYLGDAPPVQGTYFNLKYNGSLEKLFETKERSLCEFDYIFFSFERIGSKEYVEYWENVLKFIGANNFEPVFAKTPFLILKNKKVRGDCFV